MKREPSPWQIVARDRVTGRVFLRPVVCKAVLTLWRQGPCCPDCPHSSPPWLRLERLSPLLVDHFLKVAFLKWLHFLQPSQPYLRLTVGCQPPCRSLPQRYWKIRTDFLLSGHWNQTESGLQASENMLHKWRLEDNGPLEVHPLFPPICSTSVLNSGHHTWRQAPLYSPSHLIIPADPL